MSSGWNTTTAQQTEAAKPCLSGVCPADAQPTLIRPGECKAELGATAVLWEQRGVLTVPENSFSGFMILLFSMFYPL